MQQETSPASEPAPETTPPPPFENPFDFEKNERNIVRRCCSLTIKGAHCKQAALQGFNYCVQHIDRDQRAFETRGRITIPLLEDHSAVQLMCTKIMHAVANGFMKPAEANALNRTLSIVTRTLPRLKPVEQPAVVQTPGLYVTDHNYAWIALPEPLTDYEGKFMHYDKLEPSWIPKRDRKEVEAEDPDFVLAQSYRKVIDDVLRKKAARQADESAQAIAAGQPDPWAGVDRYRPGQCPYSTDWCSGPWNDHHCICCRGQSIRKPEDLRNPGDQVEELINACRTLLQKAKARLDADPATSEPSSQTINLNAAAEPGPIASSHVVRLVNKSNPNKTKAQIFDPLKKRAKQPASNGSRVSWEAENLAQPLSQQGTEAPTPSWPGRNSGDLASRARQGQGMRVGKISTSRSPSLLDPLLM